MFESNPRVDGFFVLCFYSQAGQAHSSSSTVYFSTPSSLGVTHGRRTEESGKSAQKVPDLPWRLTLVEHREEREGSSIEKGKWDTIPSHEIRHEDEGPAPRAVSPVQHICSIFVSLLPHGA